jgi:hypothetical protein
MNTALIAEYLGLAKNLGPNSTASDCARANGLVLRCMIELPADVWKRVLKAVISPTWQGAIDLALELRTELHPDDPLTSEHAAFHAPGAGLNRSGET